VQNGALYSLPYDVLNDFEPITPLVEIPYDLFARKTMLANDLRQLIARLKANPDKASTAFVAVLLLIYAPRDHSWNRTRGSGPALLQSDVDELRNLAADRIRSPS
jgi:hypothetical protein